MRKQREYVTLAVILILSAIRESGISLLVVRLRCIDRMTVCKSQKILHQTLWLGGVGRSRTRQFYALQRLCSFHCPTTSSLSAPGHGATRRIAAMFKKPPAELKTSGKHKYQPCTLDFVDDTETFDCRHSSPSQLRSTKAEAKSHI